MEDLNSKKYHSMIISFFKNNLSIIRENDSILASFDFKEDISFKQLFDSTYSHHEIFEHILKYCLKHKFNSSTYEELYFQRNFINLYRRIQESQIYYFLNKNNIVIEYLLKSNQLIKENCYNIDLCSSFIKITLDFFKNGKESEKELLLRIYSEIKEVHKKDSTILDFCLNRENVIKNNTINNSFFYFNKDSYKIDDVCELFCLDVKNLSFKILDDIFIPLSSNQYLCFNLEKSLFEELNVRNKLLRNTITNKISFSKNKVNTNFINFIYTLKKLYPDFDEQKINNSILELNFHEESINFSFWIEIKSVLMELKKFYNFTYIFKTLYNAFNDKKINIDPYSDLPSLNLALKNLQTMDETTQRKMLIRKPKRLEDITSFLYIAPNLIHHDKEINQDWEKEHSGKKVFNFFVSFPKNEKDFINIGRSLRICLGDKTYREKALSNQSQFVLLRDNKTKKVVYCLEYATKSGRLDYNLIQAKGFKNNDVPEKICIKTTDIVLKRTIFGISNPFIQVYLPFVVIPYVFTILALLSKNSSTQSALVIGTSLSLLATSLVFIFSKESYSRACLDRYPICLIASQISFLLYLIFYW